MKEAQEKIYPCDNCGKMRSKDEGGTTFTVCDECWDKTHRKPPDRPELREKIAREICRQSAVSIYSHWSSDAKENETWFRRADHILALIPDKPPLGEPPLIEVDPGCSITANMEAQRQADIKWKEGI